MTTGDGLDEFVVFGADLGIHVMRIGHVAHEVVHLAAKGNLLTKEGVVRDNDVGARVDDDFDGVRIDAILVSSASCRQGVSQFEGR